MSESSRRRPADRGPGGPRRGSDCDGDRDRGRVEAATVGLAVAVLVGAAVAAALLGLVDARPPAPAAAGSGDAGGDGSGAAGFEASLSAEGRRLVVVHRGTAPVDPAAVTLRVYVDGVPLARQPPVPFFAARGFVSGPTGPFNPATAGRWTPGEAAGLAVADTNRPVPAPGDRVTVVVARDGRTLDRASATVSRSRAFAAVGSTATVDWPGPAPDVASGTRSGSGLGSGSGSGSDSRDRDRADVGPGRYSSGARARVVIARGLPGRACWTWCSTSTKPAASNIRSASSSS